MKVAVRVLYTDGCDHTPLTIDLIKAVSSKMGLDINLETTIVENQQHAEELKFLGSPTVQVNGLDIDPSARDAESFGFM